MEYSHISDKQWDSLIINLSNERKLYNDLRGEFIQIAEEASPQFAISFENQIKNLDDIAQKVEMVANPFLVSSADRGVAILIKNGIYNIDRPYFVEKFCTPYNHLRSTIVQYSEKAKEINDAADQRKEALQKDSDNRGGVVGGGFGVEGALGGMLVAGAINTVTAAVLGTMNAVTNAVGTTGDSLQKRSIFRNEATINSIQESFYATIRDIHLAVIDALQESGVAIVFKCVSPDERDAAARIIRNVNEGLLQIDAVKPVLISAMDLDPYSVEAYRTALNKFGDKDRSLQKLAEYFHTDIRRDKRILLETIINEDSDLDTESVLSALKERGDYYGCPELAAEIAESFLRKVLSKSIICTTKEDAIQSLASLQELGKLYACAYLAEDLSGTVRSAIQKFENDEKNKALDEEAKEQFTWGETAKLVFLSMLGFIFLFIAWYIGIAFIVWAWAYNRKIKSKYRSELSADSVGRNEEHTGKL